MLDILLAFFRNRFLYVSVLSIFFVVAFFLITIIRLDSKFVIKQATKEPKKEKEEEPEEDPIKITKLNEDVIEKELSEQPQMDIEAMLEKMQADLDKKEDVVALFETEQEEKAIISYEELVNSTKRKSNENSELRMAIEQIEKKTYPKENTVFDDYEIASYIEEKEAISPSLEEPRKFKNTDFISPIYGKVENNITYPKIPSMPRKKSREQRYQNNLELGTEWNLDTDLDENKRNDEFLNALKNFRKNL